MWMVNLRAPYSARRVAFVLAVILVLGFLLLPGQVQSVFQQVGSPLGWIISWPLQVVAGIHDRIADVWGRYVALQGVEEENQQLKRELDLLKEQNGQLREASAGDGAALSAAGVQEASSSHIRGRASNRARYRQLV